ncbi:hypothetical protein MPTK1_6g12980 [Marchantia polymorpha subsp. ruderalis]|uniref:Uncharacterized protein n=2 Tax=Marchantia polymorpha TaxID=3197 RepID=A0AAF6BRH8_MARPO|nr:hypothetical protein MARPO_0059s0050 [Marchantia polymorpha]BBN14612.1 hypothetical protein Mp_6g12980 [Marchantia polymorpha subsp. ruderalis]|eukprot:PTQ37109.1 hypothetical protein MARPO_0059s0050 [Marchantia polymorpha]
MITGCGFCAWQSCAIFLVNVSLLVPCPRGLYLRAAAVRRDRAKSVASSGLADRASTIPIIRESIIWLGPSSQLVPSSTT